MHYLYLAGFAHKNQASNIDLNVVRLCFQVFIEGAEKDKFTVPLPPVVSDPIYDKSKFSIVFFLSLMVAIIVIIKRDDYNTLLSSFIIIYVFLFIHTYIYEEEKKLVKLVVHIV